jgi:hypothetical protein
MIRANGRAALDGLTRRLLRRAESIAHRRASEDAGSNGAPRHDWRSAASLWPDLFKDR